MFDFLFDTIYLAYIYINDYVFPIRSKCWKITEVKKNSVELVIMNGQTHRSVENNEDSLYEGQKALKTNGHLTF